MTAPPLLTTTERATLSPEDRDLLDRAVQRIPSERSDEFMALMLSIRAIVRHDTAQVRNTVSGVFELQDAADDARRELIAAAKEFRHDAAALAATVATATGEIAELRKDFQSFQRRVTDDAEALHRQANRADRRIALLLAAVVLLWIELLYRYGSAILGALFLVMIVIAGLWT